MRAEPGIYTARPGNSHSTQAGGTKYKEILFTTKFEYETFTFSFWFGGYILYKYLNFFIISEYNYLMVQSPEFESSQV